jgi:hypothetical protein
MFAGINPHLAVQKLYELNILPYSLKMPLECSELQDVLAKKQRIFLSLKSVQALHHTLTFLEQNPLLFEKPLSIQEKENMYNLALILPFKSFLYTQKGKNLKVYEYIINDGLKVFTLFIE